MSIVFALDSSERDASVCILQQQQQNGPHEVLFQTEITAGLTHSETLLPLVEQVFSETALSPRDVSFYAVSAGPGSFTGLRIGLSLVKGMALPYGTPVAPVSTLWGLARSVTQTQGTLVPALNARRGEVYWAAFDPVQNGARLLDDMTGPAADLEAFLANFPEPIFFIGSGAEICYTLYKEKYTVRLQPPHLPMARGIALAGLEMMADGRLVPAAQARPVYLRLSQAERERAAKLVGGTQ